MVRDFFDNTYHLFRGHEEEAVNFNKEEHFQPVFFAKDIESLRNNTEAQRALRKYRIFVKPEEIEKAIEESKAITKLKLGLDDNLPVKLEEDRAVWEHLFEME